MSATEYLERPFQTYLTVFGILRCAILENNLTWIESVYAGDSDVKTAILDCLASAGISSGRRSTLQDGKSVEKECTAKPGQGTTRNAASNRAK